MQPHPLHTSATGPIQKGDCCKQSWLLSESLHLRGFFSHLDTEGEFVDQVSLLFSPSEYNKLCRKKQHGGSEAIYTSLWL